MQSAMLVREELQKSLATARQYVDAWMCDPSTAGLMDKAITELHQVRGILRVVEFRGAIELSTVLLQCCAALSAGCPQRGESNATVLLDSFASLERYVENCTRQQQLNPLLVVEPLNRLRARLRQPAMLEQELLGFKPGKIPELAAAEDYALAEEELARARRLLHMYQVGLLAVLRDKNVPSNLHLMERSINRLRHDFLDLANEEWWLLVSAVLQRLRSNALRLTSARKRMVALVDGYLRKRCKADTVEPTQLLPLHRDALLCLLLLAGDDTPLRNGICRQYGLPAPEFDDAALGAMEQALGESPAVALNAVSQDVSVQVEKLKALLESNRDNMSAEIVADAVGHLQSIGDALAGAGFIRLKGVLVDKAFTVNQSVAAGVTSEAAVQSVAEALMLVENTLRNPDCFDDRAMAGEYEGAEGSQLLAREMLEEATGVVINESKSAISVAKRGITAYLDSGFDAVHIANVGASLRMVVGAFQILGHERAAAVLRQCIAHLDHCGVRGVSEQSRREIETLADALISLEYYLDELSTSDRENSDLLSLAEQSVLELSDAA
jgi:hypothetical protein